MLNPQQPVTLTMTLEEYVTARELIVNRDKLYAELREGTDTERAVTIKAIDAVDESLAILFCDVLNPPGS